MDFMEFEKLLKNTDKEEGVFATFYDKAVKTSTINDKGLPVFNTVCYCQIQIKDNRDVFDQPATQDKINRFPVEYARYQLAKKQASTGTPLEKFAFLTLEEIESLKFRGIFTVEALAEIEESKANDLGLEGEHKKAKEFLELAANNMAVNKITELEASYAQEKEAIEAVHKQEKETLEATILQLKEELAAAKRVAEDLMVEQDSNANNDVTKAKKA